MGTLLHAVRFCHTGHQVTTRHHSVHQTPPRAYRNACKGFSGRTRLLAPPQLTLLHASCLAGPLRTHPRGPRPDQKTRVLPDPVCHLLPPYNTCSGHPSCARSSWPRSPGLLHLLRSGSWNRPGSANLPGPYALAPNFCLSRSLLSSAARGRTVRHCLTPPGLCGVSATHAFSVVWSVVPDVCSLLYSDGSRGHPVTV